MQEFGKQQKIVIGMVGLPARGKTYMARKMNRYLNWLGYKSRVFNIGNYRRDICGTDCNNNFFDPFNQNAVEQRTECARRAFSDLTHFLNDGGDVGIYDGTNSTKGRRQLVKKELNQRLPNTHLFWVESICNDQDVIQTNIKLTKLNNPDYQSVNPDDATNDFLKRIDNYLKVYEPLDDSEDISYIKVIDIGKDIILHNVNGYLQAKLVSFLMNLHIYPRAIYFLRPGESLSNRELRIGGDQGITVNGQKFALNCCKFFNEEFKSMDLSDGIQIMTSTMKRAIQTVEILSKHLGHQYLSLKTLDEINVGVCDGMTYEEIKQQYPEEYKARMQDRKLNYRYPRGESYLDLISRIEPVIYEIERSRKPVIVIGHQAILRCVYGYFNQEDLSKIPYLNIPINQIIKIIPHTYNQMETRFMIHIDTNIVEELIEKKIKKIQSYIDL